MKRKKNTFESKYFEEYYKGIGDFSEEKDKKLKNWFKGVLNYVHKFVPLKGGKIKKVLEFGCATGIVSALLSERGYDVLGTDVSTYAVSKARKLHPEVKFLTHDMQKPFPKKDFDLVFAFDVIEHLRNPQLGIKNAYNALKKGGFIVLSTCGDAPGISTDPTHINIKTADEWNNILIKSGFRDIIVKHVTILPYFYRLNWHFSIIMPFPTASPYIISPVFIFARK